MYDFLQTAIAFIVTLGVLIAVHEFGHFWVARRCGVRVLRFSIGFGQPLFRWHDRQGTEFVVAAIPFGGYVKMLGEPGSDEVADYDERQSFAHKSVLQRIAIVAAGPLINLVFAVLLYWLIFVIGVTRIVPLIGEVAPEGLAARAGLVSGAEIVAVDGKPTQSWDQVSLALVSRLGETGEILVTTRQAEGYAEQDHRIPVDRWMVGFEKEGPLAALGMEQFMPRLPVEIGHVVPERPAALAGLQVGDRVVSVDGVSLTDWSEWVDYIRARPEQPINLQIERQGSLHELTVVPETQSAPDGTLIGQIGAAPKPWDVPEELLREVHYGPVEALTAAVVKTRDFIALTLGAIGKMATGLIALDNLSGPLTIAKVAGNTASFGWEPFLGFMAYLSISLGVLNLLPIPVLDGGHLMFYLVEMLKGSPVSERAQQFGNSLGLALLVTFMGLAFYNDIMAL